MKAKTHSRMLLRTLCRERWGKDWHNVHPVIKKARLMWAAGGDVSGRKVLVFDTNDTYVA